MGRRRYTTPRLDTPRHAFHVFHAFHAFHASHATPFTPFTPVNMDSEIRENPWKVDVKMHTVLDTIFASIFERIFIRALQFSYAVVLTSQPFMHTTLRGMLRVVVGADTGATSVLPLLRCSQEGSEKYSF